MDKLDKANKKIEKDCPSTIFDTFDFHQYLRSEGGALRDDLVKLTSLYARVSKLANHAKKLYEDAKERRDEVEAIAWAKAGDLKPTEKKMIIKTLPIDYEGEVTSLIEENKSVAIYNFLQMRGKSKMDELSNLLDLSRTFLSWDKSEQQKGQY